MKRSSHRTIGDEILYTGISQAIAISAPLAAANRSNKAGNRNVQPVVARNYSSFLRHFEAQSFSDVPPFIRAHRPKLPHPVYEISNYRMRYVHRIFTDACRDESRE
jgi:hypothetical protein